MADEVRGTGQQNPFELTTTGEFMRSKMLEIPLEGTNGRGKDIVQERPWSTSSFEMIDFSDLSTRVDKVREGSSINLKAIDPEEFRRTAKATVISGFVRRGVDYEKIDPEVLNRITDAYITSDQRQLSLIQRALTWDGNMRQEKARYVNWNKVAPSEQFGEFEGTVSSLREGSPPMRVGRFLDFLAKSEKAPKLPNDGSGTGGGNVDPSKMTTMQLLARCKASPSRRTMIDNSITGTPPQVYVQPPRLGVVATLAQGLRLLVAPRPVRI